MVEPQYVQVATRGSTMERARQQSKGMPVAAVSHLAKMIHVPEKRVLEIIDFKPASYYRSRRKSGSLLARDQTETVGRLMRLYHVASHVLPDPATWFQTPSPHLEGATPLEFARTEDGGRVVESLLQRIDHGSVA